MRKRLIFALGAALLIVLTWTALAQVQAPETAKDPVCGMTVKIATAKHTYDYKGATYYFCSEGCKTSFSKEPEKYLAKTAEAKPGGMMGQGMGMMHAQAGQAGMPGMGGNCMCMLPDVEKKFENTPAGVVITLTSKNPETVKKLQEHAAMMKDGKCPMMGKDPAAKEGEAGCPMGGGCPMKKK